jgi:hypothetical protein
MRHLNAPPYPQAGRPPMQFNAANHQNAQQPTISQSEVSDTQGYNQLGGTHRSSAYPNQLQSTYDSSAPGYHAQGQVTNSLNIDPALLAMGQGARQQTPTHQFNMHPGSQVTFAGNAFQQSFGPNAFQQSLITQGNQNMRLEGTETPADDAGQMNVDAHMFDTSTYDFSGNLFLSKHGFDPTISAYGLGSFHNKLKDSLLMPPPPLSPRALAYNPINNDYVVFAQQGGAHPSPSPDVTSAELMINSEGHSVGGTSAMQESSGDSRPSVSQAKKRGRSSSAEGSSNVSIEDFKPQGPTAQRKRVRTSQSSGSSAYVSSSESQVSISMSRRESLLAADYSNFKVASGPLQGMSPDEAADMYIKRVALNISGIDDFNEVKAEREKWIRAIMQAFDDPYNQTPKTKTVDLEEFQRWQKEHHALTMEVFEQDPTGRLAVAIATHLYNQVVEGHTKGSLVKSSGNSFKHDDKLKCKDRLENIIKALTGLTIIRFDLVTGARVHELVANPDAVFKRKEENKLENDRKKVKKEAADAAKATNNKKAADALTEKNVKTNASNIAKGGNKRRGKSKPAVVEEDEESDHASDSEASVSSARNVSTSVLESEPVDDHMEAPWRKRPGHRRSGFVDGVHYESSSGSDDPVDYEAPRKPARNTSTCVPEPANDAEVQNPYYPQGF